MDQKPEERGSFPADASRRCGRRRKVSRSPAFPAFTTFLPSVAALSLTGLPGRSEQVQALSRGP